MVNLLYSENRMKIGVMAFNCSHVSTVTTHGRWIRGVIAGRTLEGLWR